MASGKYGVAGLLALAAGCVFAPSADAASDIYLKIEGIPGESADTAHRGEIEVESWSLGATQSTRPTFGAPAGAGRTAQPPKEPPQGPGGISVSKSYDKSSPKLAEACAQGKHFPKATLTVRKTGGGQQEYMTYELENVLISGYSLSGGGGGGGAGGSAKPMESLSINYTKIQFKTAPDASGAAGKTGYDVAPAKKI